jgi:uncharacterized tellurite resistance protein B-like protein
MHVLLGILGSIITILILLKRLADSGIDLAGLNPFLWHRRRQWRMKVQGNPIHAITSPMELTALLMTATAKIDGDMSSEEKTALRSFMQTEFQLSKRDAADLLISSAYTLGDGNDLRKNLDAVMNPGLENFSEVQARSALELLVRLGNIDPAGNELKREFIGQVRQIFDARFAPQGKWQ